MEKNNETTEVIAELEKGQASGNGGGEQINELDALEQVEPLISGAEQETETVADEKGQAEETAGLATAELAVEEGIRKENQPETPVSIKEMELIRWAKEAEKIRKANQAKQAEEIKDAQQPESVSGAEEADGPKQANKTHKEREEDKGDKPGKVKSADKEDKPGQANSADKEDKPRQANSADKGDKPGQANSADKAKNGQSPGKELAEESESSSVQENHQGKKRKEKPARSFKERDRMITAVQEAVMLFLTIVISAVAAFLHGQTAALMAGIAILAGIGFCSTMFCISLSGENGSFLFDNEGNIWRFTITYLLFLGGSIALPMLPAGAWPYPVIFVGLMLFSNQLIGLSAGCTLLMISAMIYGDMGAFFIYFASGLVGIVVFSYANEVMQVWLPLMVTLLAHMVCLSIHELLFASSQFSMELFILPAANLLASFFLMLILLKFSSACRDWNRYMDINDPESKLLAQLKEISGKDYYHAIHTAYLCERVVKELFLDARVVKACGYYHRIGLLKGENTWGNIQQVLKKNHFPREVKLILREYTDRDKRKMVISKEAVVLLFCDEVISVITSFFSEKKDVKPDCQKIINAIFARQLDSGMIDDSSITIGELQQIKKALIEEDAYYDLLR